MYLPKMFENLNPEAIGQFIRSNPFGMIISQSNGNMTATHIPMELVLDENKNWTIVGHISKANDQWNRRTGRSQTRIFFILSRSPISGFKAGRF